MVIRRSSDPDNLEKYNSRRRDDTDMTDYGIMMSPITPNLEEKVDRLENLLHKIRLEINHKKKATYKNIDKLLEDEGF